ncbi:hypothetical protein CRG98_007517 [Punica granatum]|uniref:Uncharacterized protein n=1 Tax=Punica granatum TaxID=22663 RepID=A0A2I0KUX5_PUNGR|nr:hypothetical protein CRG98_007517 [Punica granatum]
MNYGRGAWSTKKTGESNQKDAFSDRAPGGPIHGRVNSTRKRVHKHLRTTRTMEQVPDRLSRLLLVSRWSRTPLGESSERVSDEQRPQRSPNTSGHSGNTEKTPVAGLGTFGTFHECLDLSLRSPRNPILHCAVVRASVPTPFSPSCRYCCLTGAHCPSRPAESCDSQGHFPDSFPRASRLGNIPLRLREARILDWETTYFEVGEALVVRRGHGNSRPCLPKGWPRVPLSLTDARGALSPRSSLLPTPYCL